MKDILADLKIVVRYITFKNSSQAQEPKSQPILLCIL